MTVNLGSNPVDPDPTPPLAELPSLGWTGRWGLVTSLFLGVFGTAVWIRRLP